MSNKFRNPSNARYLKALFVEFNPLQDTAVYTLKDEDHKGFPSLYRLYMEAADPMEYRFAVQNLDGWDHWQMLTATTWFKPYVERWRKELSTKIQSVALNNIILEAGKESSKNSFSANKFLIERGWVERNTKGRPTASDVKRAAKEQAQEDVAIREAWERLEAHGGVSN